MAQTVRNVVEDDANWTIRIRNEQKRANEFGREWGFLSMTDRRMLSRSVSPVKYIGTGATWTVKQIRVPERKGQGVQLPVVPSSRLQERPLRPSTAMESVVMSNVLVTEQIQRVNPFFVQTSHKYGSRLSLEQFGVSQHGIRGNLQRSAPR